MELYNSIIKKFNNSFTIYKNGGIMRKFCVIILNFLLLTNICFAQDLVLSDVIREAREAQLKQQAMQKTEMAMQPVKNNCSCNSMNEEKYTKTKNNTAQFKEHRERIGE